MGVLRAFPALQSCPCTVPSAATYASPSPSPGVKINPHVCPQKWQRILLRFTGTPLPSVTNSDCTRYPKEDIVISLEAIRIPSLFRLLLFELLLYYSSGPKTIGAFSAISILFWNQKYPKIELRQNLIWKTYAIRTSPKPFLVRTRNAEAVRLRKTKTTISGHSTYRAISAK